MPDPTLFATLPLPCFNVSYTKKTLAMTGFNHTIFSEFILEDEICSDGEDGIRRIGAMPSDQRFDISLVV